MAERPVSAETPHLLPLWSKLKPAEKFMRTWLQYGYQSSDLQREYRFHPERMFRLDFAWTSCKVGVEIHGFGWGHQAQQHLAGDCEKIRAAIEEGWIVVPFTTRCIASRDNCREAVEYVCLLLSRRHGIITASIKSSKTTPAAADFA